MKMLHALTILGHCKLYSQWNFTIEGFRYGDSPMSLGESRTCTRNVYEMFIQFQVKPMYIHLKFISTKWQEGLNPYET